MCPKHTDGESRSAQAEEFQSRRVVNTALVALGACALTLSRGALAADKPLLLVFIPSDQKPHSIEKALKPALPGLQVMVFGKSRDFVKGVRSLKPDAVLAPAAVLKAMSLPPTLRGMRSGIAEEVYVMITVDQAISPQSLGDHTVGAFGIMGRREMRSFCGRLLGTGSQKIKTVTKYADLLPLLQFQVAKAVVLPRRFAGVVTERSELKLVVSEIPNRKVGLVVLSVIHANLRDRVVAAIRGLNQSSRLYMGVDGWR